MGFPKTVKQAKKMNLPVFRECRYFTNVDGIPLALYGSWDIEFAYNWRKRRKKGKQK
jgi:hypothetical protein